MIWKYEISAASGDYIKTAQIINTREGQYKNTILFFIFLVQVSPRNYAKHSKDIAFDSK